MSLDDPEVKKDSSAEDDLTMLLGGTHIYQPVYTLTQAGEQALAQHDVKKDGAEGEEVKKEDEGEEQLLRRAIAMSLAQYE